MPLKHLLLLLSDGLLPPVEKRSNNDSTRCLDEASGGLQRAEKLQAPDHMPLCDSKRPLAIRCLRDWEPVCSAGSLPSLSLSCQLYPFYSNIV